MLDAHQELYSGMLPGSRIGFLPRSAAGFMTGRHLAGLSNRDFNLPDGMMLVWEVSGDGTGMRANLRPCRNLHDTQADLLLVLDETALGEIRRSFDLDNNPFCTIKKLIRCGNILLFVMKTKYELQDAGYEDFLDMLGLAFLGACR